MFSSFDSHKQIKISKGELHEPFIIFCFVYLCNTKTLVAKYRTF